MSTVELRKIVHTFGRTKVLRGLNLRLDSGAYVVLLGKSGCGKTTMLRVIAGLLKQTSGTVHLGGQCVDQVKPRDRNVSMVFQNDGLYPHLTIRQSIAFAVRKNVDAADVSQRTGEAAELMGAVDLLDCYPGRLSGGELRRAAITKAIARRASIRLMDEPLSALDGSVRHSLQDDLLAWHGQVNGTTLHVTHDGQEAMRMADKIGVIEDGDIVQMATPSEIYDRPQSRSVALAIGVPPINLLPTRRCGEAIRPSGGFKFDRRGVETELGIRGESLQLLGRDERIDSPGVTLTGRVVRVTAMDGTSHVRVSLGEGAVEAVLSGLPAIETGQRCRLFAAADQLHLFDVDSGQRIEADSDR